MRRRPYNAMGALHPVLFCMFIYGISLIMAIFVCRTVYYSLNEDQSAAKLQLPVNSSNRDMAALK